jgi:hypothetical protein
VYVVDWFEQAKLRRSLVVLSETAHSSGYFGAKKRKKGRFVRNALLYPVF